MTHRTQLLILAAVLILLTLAILFPRPASSDQPVAASRIPASEFAPVVGSSPILEEPAPSPSASKRVPTPTPVRPRAAVSPTVSKAGVPESVTGQASWFRSPRGVSAAGPALRTAIGPNWRGRQVSVCAGRRCVSTILGDWMAADRLIDLDDNVFARLAPLSRGVVEVSVRW